MYFNGNIILIFICLMLDGPVVFCKYIEITTFFLYHGTCMQTNYNITRSFKFANVKVNHVLYDLLIFVIIYTKTNTSQVNIFVHYDLPEYATKVFYFLYTLFTQTLLSLLLKATQIGCVWNIFETYEL